MGKVGADGRKVVREVFVAIDDRELDAEPSADRGKRVPIRFRKRVALAQADGENMGQALLVLAKLIRPAQALGQNIAVRIVVIAFFATRGRTIVLFSGRV